MGWVGDLGIVLHAFALSNTATQNFWMNSKSHQEWSNRFGWCLVLENELLHLPMSDHTSVRLRLTLCNRSQQQSSRAQWVLARSKPQRTPGPWFNIKMSSYQYRKSRGDKTVVRSSYLHNGISFTGMMSSLYWIRALILISTRNQ